MAKDPAFLFYPNDYLGGTMGMTFEEKGAYMELLMLQFNRGHMTKHMMAQTVGQLLDKVLDKFEIDADGLYFNARLELEKEKRKAFVNSRLNNKEGKNQYSKKGGHMTSHMENENENRNDNVIEDFGKSENLLPVMFRIFKKKKPNYPDDQTKDFHALKNISAFICKQSGLSYQPMDKDVGKTVFDAWEIITDYLVKDDFYGNKSLQSVSYNIQSIVQKIQHESTGGKASGKPGSKVLGTQLDTALAKFRNKGQSVGHS